MAKYGATGVSAVTDTRIKAFMQLTGEGSEVACSMLRGFCLYICSWLTLNVLYFYIQSVL